MVQIHFCPYCDASAHKVVSLEKDDQYFCKSCNKFFMLSLVERSCPKCGGTRCQDSDFPSPDGQIVIQCQSCKKMFSLKEFIEKQVRKE